MELVAVLGGQVLRSEGAAVGEVKKAVAGIVGRMAVYFPFGSSASAAERVRRPERLWQAC